MRVSFSSLIPFSKLFRQMEQDVETVVKVLQPGAAGILEHKFPAEEIREANATVRRAIENWRRNAVIERQSGVLNDFIHN